MAKPVRSTLYDVAELAQVSFKTVSRAVNGEARVSPETRARVLSAAARLNYHPSMSARSLAGGRSHLLCLILDAATTASPYISHVQTGLTQACRAHSHHLLVEALDLSSSKTILPILKSLHGGLRLDGFILTPPVCDNKTVLAFLEQAGCNYVRIAPDLQPERAACVMIDDEAAAYRMTSYLIELGHREIGFVGGPSDHGASRRRRDGYVAALSAHGLDADSRRIQPGDFQFRSGLKAAEQLLKDETITAIFASNDDMALGVMAHAARRGLNLPGELSIAGFDDIPMAAATWPSLTTVRQPIAQMAALAAEMIIAGELRGPDGAPVANCLPFDIVERASTGPIKRCRAFSNQRSAPS